MYHFYADDAIVTPSRAGMGKLICAGGILVPAAEVPHLSEEVENLAELIGLPRSEEFKWSPSRDSWLRKNLVEGSRTQFFTDLLKACKRHEVLAMVCINEASSQTCTSAIDHQSDVTTLLLERVESASSGSDVMFFVDRPGGGRAEETQFVRQCMDTIRTGTRFKKFASLSTPPIPLDSRFNRLVQLSDLVVSATGSYVGGEARFAPATFESVRPLLRKVDGRVGGIGLKLHPDFRFANLYHWLLGDERFQKHGVSCPLPLRGRTYASGPDTA